MAAQSRNIAELENASVWRLLIQYSLPSIAGMVVYSLYNIIDSVFIGHGVGPLALSGLAVTFPIMNLTFALGTLVGIGGAAISSIRLGRKDQEGTERTLGNVLIMSLIAAVVLVIPTLLSLRNPDRLRSQRANPHLCVRLHAHYLAGPARHVRLLQPQSCDESYRLP